MHHRRIFLNKLINTYVMMGLKAIAKLENKPKKLSLGQDCGPPR